MSDRIRCAQLSVLALIILTLAALSVRATGFSYPMLPDVSLFLAFCFSAAFVYVARKTTILPSATVLFFYFPASVWALNEIGLFHSLGYRAFQLVALLSAVTIVALIGFAAPGLLSRSPVSSSPRLPRLLSLSAALSLLLAPCLLAGVLVYGIDTLWCLMPPVAAAAALAAAFAGRLTPSRRFSLVGWWLLLWFGALVSLMVLLASGLASWRLAAALDSFL